MTRVALKGLLRRKTRAAPDLAGHRARRGDDQRHVRPHRHDREGVQQRLRHRLRQDRRRHHRQGGRQGLRAATRRCRPRSSTEVRRQPGVAAAAATLRRHRPARRRDGKAHRRHERRGPSASASTPAEPRFNPITLTSGTWAEGPDEVVIDTGTAKDDHYAVGDTIGADGRRAASAASRITGIGKLGGADDRRR